ncbi:hypothetical protein OV208_06675 [Corallococcus sp. bb12-1]|uniref:hypothetical protein n=1 Tax=Corallococcus sp. bb12-1 TaxID=2996784 RepID=UPI002271CE27|nr:hypothetical protein [Corallococcus sp. bb12-1]MCY1040996.1 hypothetical protein [Corallococcus sp. bb12-1]
MSSPPLPPAPTTDPEATDRPGNAAPETFRPLKELVAEVDSPGVLHSDIDALVAALRQPPPFAEPLQARADLLRELVARDHPVGEHTGRDGTTVRQAAVAALLALGPAYTRDVPAEVLNEAPAPVPAARTPAPDTQDGASSGSRAFLIASLCALYQSFAIFGVHALFPFFRVDFTEPLSKGVLIPLLLVWGPPLLSMVGHAEKSRSLQVLGSVAMWLQVVAWVLVGFGFVMGSVGVLIVVTPWHLAAWAAFVMHPAKQPEEAPAPPSTP